MPDPDPNATPEPQPQDPSPAPAPAAPAQDPQHTPGQPIMSLEDFDRRVSARVTAEVKKARKEEKTKLYSTQEELRGKLQEAEAAREKLTAQLDEMKQKQDPEKATLTTRVQEMEATIRSLQDDLKIQQEQMQLADERSRAERQEIELRAYADRRIVETQSEGKQIIPEMIHGNSVEEIEDSIQRSIARANQLVNEREAMAQQLRADTPLAGGGGPRGPAPAGPPSGAGEITAEELRNMPLSEYKKRRGELHAMTGVPVSEVLTPRR